jgi:LEA14-like dessication related protein
MIGRRRLRAVALLLLAVALGGCALLVPRLETPRLSIIAIRVRKASFLEQQLDVRLRVENPNDRSLPIQAVSYTLFIGGQEFAAGVSDAAFLVPALGTADFDMEVNANAAGALFVILSRPSGQAVAYRMKGRVQLSHGWLRSIPFEERGTFTLR